MNLAIIYLFFFVGSLVFSLIINRIFLKFSKSLGIRNTDETIIRWDSSSKPALGGISFFILFLLSVTFYSLLFNSESPIYNVKFSGVLLACTIGFLIGLADDAYNTQPLLKFLGQVSCAVILIFTGTIIDLFESEILNMIFTVFWIVAIMNSINMLDNMDAVSTVVSLFIIATIFLVICLKDDFTNPYLLILIGTFSALMGFLRFNWNPSQMYMGDTGSQFLGILLGAMAIEFLWNGSGSFTGSISQKFLIVTVVFIIPIVDTTTVTINRLLKGNSPFVGGKDHTTHHLSYVGLNEKQIALIFSGISLFSGYLAISISGEWDIFLASTIVVYSLFVFIVLFSVTRIKRKAK